MMAFIFSSNFAHARTSVIFLYECIFFSRGERLAIRDAFLHNFYALAPDVCIGGVSSCFSFVRFTDTLKDGRTVG